MRHLSNTSTMIERQQPKTSTQYLRKAGQRTLQMAPKRKKEEKEYSYRWKGGEREKEREMGGRYGRKEAGTEGGRQGKRLGG